jgi:hypothetical protein
MAPPKYLNNVYLLIGIRAYPRSLRGRERRPHGLDEVELKSSTFPFT